MSTFSLNGKQYSEMLSGGLALLSEHIDELNSLNVFPVADGDTGTNMYSTIDGGVSALDNDDTDSIGEVSRVFSRAALLSARGNSGVILSQIFAGINDGLSGVDIATVEQISESYKNAIKTAYSSVQNPTEGTILTVFRESVEYALSMINESSSIDDFYKFHVEQARRSLERTPTLLPALAESGVVDSGGAGYLRIAEGMYAALVGEKLPESNLHHKEKKPQIDIDSFTRDSVLEFGYCTEFLLRLMTAKVDPDGFDISTVTSHLTRLGGESIVAYKQDDIVKVHVHSFTPGVILAEMQQYGEFLTVKIENMSLGHSESLKKEKKTKKKIATVAVACGEGLTALFKDMGADYVIAGGQTANPSIEDFITAFDSFEAEDVIVLPNNKNILLAADQAAKVYDKAKIHVVPTKNFMQGYSALSVISPGITDIEMILSSAKLAAESVTDGEITKAIRDVTLEGNEIHKNDYMVISSGHIIATAESAEDAVMEMLSKTDADLCEIITLFTGSDVDADRRVALTDRIAEKYPDLELTVYEGGQEVYDYLIALE